MAKATAAAKPRHPYSPKEQLLRSQRYAKHRDLLGALQETVSGTPSKRLIPLSKTL